MGMLLSEVSRYSVHLKKVVQDLEKRGDKLKEIRKPKVICTASSPLLVDLLCPEWYQSS